MANTLNEDLEGRTVIIKAEALLPKYAEPHQRVFHVDGGFGAKTHTTGNAVFGTFVADGEKCRVEGWQVERFATDEEIATAKAVVKEGS